MTPQRQQKHREFVMLSTLGRLLRFVGCGNSSSVALIQRYPVVGPLYKKKPAVAVTIHHRRKIEHIVRSQARFLPTTNCARVPYFVCPRGFLPPSAQAPAQSNSAGAAAIARISVRQALAARAFPGWRA